jgi:ribosomal protein S18 acetylase RimI-like enzyme
MSQTFLARLMRRADVDEVLAVHLSLFEVKYSRSTIEQFLTSTYLSLVLVHVDNATETIVGVSVSSREWIAICNRQRRAYLSTFGILPDFQRRGLGAHLFRLTCDILRMHFTVSEIRLHMLKGKQGTYDFYIAQQLVAIGVLKDYYSLGEGFHDAILMARDLRFIPKIEPRDDVAILPELVELLNTTQWVCPFAQLVLPA